MIQSLFVHPNQNTIVLTTIKSLPRTIGAFSVMAYLLVVFGSVLSFQVSASVDTAEDGCTIVDSNSMSDECHHQQKDDVPQNHCSDKNAFCGSLCSITCISFLPNNPSHLQNYKSEITVSDLDVSVHQNTPYFLIPSKTRTEY